MSDPLIAAAREIVITALSDIRACVEGASPGALNWRPASGETNSIAVLAAHALGSTRSWISIAVGAPLPLRNRTAEFEATTEGADALAELVDEIGRDCLRLLNAAGALDWAAPRATHVRPTSDLASEVPAAWALMHALEHMREHVGQMQLTRQLADGLEGRAG